MRAVAALALVALLTGAGHRVGSAGVTVRLPPGWHSPADFVQGNVTNPLTRVVVASARIRSHPTGCQVGAYAFARTTVAIVILEWLPPLGARQAPRPRRFDAKTLKIRAGRTVECFDGRGGDVEFDDHGRHFGAYLLVGTRAGAATIAAARRVLDTLQVE